MDMCLSDMCLSGMCLSGMCLSGMCLSGMCLSGLCLFGMRLFATGGVAVLALLRRSHTFISDSNFAPQRPGHPDDQNASLRPLRRVGFHVQRRAPSGCG
ncbi:hypothetical protein FIU94_13730 [Sulfitobacter sp. THAF37]|nr:hypothetical protein FIU94_13730 [Sulfitobacter sp. THAF37]